MGKRKSHRKARCPVARPLDAIGDSWSLLLVRDAMEGRSRFSEFQKSLGLAKNVLSDRLRNLLKHEVFELVPVSEESLHHKYVLTERGRALFPLLVTLRQWGEECFFAGHETHVKLVDRKRRRLVPRIRVIAEDGRELRPEDRELIR